MCCQQSENTSASLGMLDETISDNEFMPNIISHFTHYRIPNGVEDIRLFLEVPNWEFVRVDYAFAEFFLAPYHHPSAPRVAVQAIKMGKKCL